MTDWIEHKAGDPQPVADDVWVMTPAPDMQTFVVQLAKSVPWRFTSGLYRIVNQHLIKAARLEGIRLGLEAAEEAAHEYAYQCRAGGHFEVGIAFATHADDLRNLNPDTIAKEADND